MRNAKKDLCWETRTMLAHSARWMLVEDRECVNIGGTYLRDYRRHRRIVVCPVGIYAMLYGIYAGWLKYNFPVGLFVIVIAAVEI